MANMHLLNSLLDRDLSFFTSTIKKDALGTSLLPGPRLLTATDLYTTQNELSAKQITL
jgi:hypothetical protein